MKEKLKEIAQGWFNELKDTLGILSPEIKEMALNRLKICLECPIQLDGTCSSSLSGKAVQDFKYNTAFYSELRFKDQEYKGCGCPLSVKSKSSKSNCPLGKFLDVEQQKEKDGNRTEDKN